MRKVLVTGGSGFIGSHVCNDLARRGIAPVIFDHHALWHPDLERTYFLGDVCDYAAVSEAVAISDGVIHLAGVLGTQETIREPLPAVQTNIVGSLNVFKACEHYQKKAVLITVGNFWMENTYSITKTTAERFAAMFNREHGTKIAVVRGLNAYGPGQKAKPVRKIIPNFIIPALNDEKLLVYGDGLQVMDMIYVEDLAEILVKALLEDHGIYDRVFEAGTGKRTTVLEIAEEVIRQVGAGRVKFAPMRPGEPENSTVIGDPETLSPLGVDPAKLVSLEAGLAKTITWFRENR